MGYRAGFDIGGSHIAGGIYDETDVLVRRVTKPFPKANPASVPALIAAAAEEMTARCGGIAALESVGLAVPGSIDRARENVIHAYNLGFHDFPLRANTAALIAGVPVCIGNDADAAALAEYRTGALKGVGCGILVTLGTGVGGGIIINGRLWRGGMGNGSELGHCVMDMRGATCSCGVRGCCETLCSATALVRKARAAAGTDAGSLLNQRTGGDSALIDAKTVIDCAREGDERALAVFDEYTDALSSMCASLINLIDPEIIAFGGGVSAAGDFLFEPVREKTRSKSFYAEHARILPAILGNDAGMLGAALLHELG